MSHKAEELKIPVPWGHVIGKWWGPKNIAPVICLHGWQDNAGTFDTLAPLLPPEVALLALDLPGHGLSSPLHPGQFYCHWWDGVQVVRRVVKHLGLDEDTEKIRLMGHSRGGSVAFLYAATFPDQVEKLICIDNAFPKLLNPAKIADQTGADVDRFLKYDSGQVEGGRCFRKEVMLDVAYDAYSGSVTKEGIEVLMRRGMLPVPSKPKLFRFTRDPKIKVSSLGVFSKHQVLAHAQKITCEYLNIRAVPGIGFEYSELYDDVLSVIKENSKRFEYHRVPGTHHLHLNEPESVSEIIGNFLVT